MSALQSAVKEAIAQRNIGLILPPFIHATFYAVAHGTEDRSLFLSRSPKGGLCITVAEQEELLTLTAPVVAKSITAYELLATPYEILIVFNDGGYCLDKATLDWFREVLKDAALDV